MGLDVQSLRLLLLARRMGASFKSVLTIGRQDLLMTPKQISETCELFGLSIGFQETHEIAFGNDRFCEPMLHRLGAEKVDSMDASDFEGATIIHDLNQEIAEGPTFDLVFDGGTLEHVFNFPVALKTCMNMVAEGGHYLMSSPANNHMGHGFYQFSPDLYYRVFSSENGFELKELFLVPTYSEGQWYRIADPREKKSRIGYNDDQVSYSLFGIAKRIATSTIFLRPPQQADYAANWIAGENSNRLQFFDDAMNQTERRSPLRGLMPESIRRIRRSIVSARRARLGPDRNFFEPFDFNSLPRAAMPSD